MRIKLLVFIILAVFLLTMAGCQSSGVNTAESAGKIPEKYVGRFIIEDTYFKVFDILPDGTFYFNDNRQDYFSGGNIEIANDIVTFRDTFGPCINQVGKYRWVPKDSGFFLVWGEDTCTNRVNLLTEAMFVKVPQMYPYVNFAWKVLTQDTGFIAVDNQDNIYVSDGTRGIHKLSSDGKIIQSWSGFTTAAGIAVAGSGNIYVVDNTELKIKKLDPDGNLLTSWKTNSKIFGAEDIAVDDQENVFVSFKTPQDFHVEKFDSDGNFLGAWAAQGNGVGQAFALGKLGPVEIASEPGGNHYLADPLNNRVMKFDPDGNFLLNITGGGGDVLVGPKYINLDGAGNIYILDESQSIWKFDPNGGFIGHWFTPSWGSIAIDSNGNIVIADFRQVVKVNLP